jgi:putative sigma-54 modulation protein
MAIRVEMSAKNIELTEHMLEIINKKMARIERLLTDIDNVHVELKYLKSARNIADRNVTQVTLHGKGYILRAEEGDADIFAAIDKAMDKLARQVDRFKGKRDKFRANHLIEEPVIAEHLEKEQPAENPLIARRKQFNLIPMDELEAIEQMKMLGHENFFVFYNIETDSINVLYSRKDGSYGIIIPKLG